MLLPLWLALAALVPAGNAAPAGKTIPKAGRDGALPGIEFAAPAGALYPERSTAPIVVVWPPEGLTMPACEGEFILGSVSDPSAPFAINGTTVAAHPNGAFLAWLPVTPGTFAFRCRLDLKGGTTSFTRTIFVTPSPAPPPEKPLAIDSDSLWPNSDAEMRPGDWLTFRMRASPGRKAQCRLGSRPWQDLREGNSGIYDGMQAVNPGENAKPAAAECRLQSGWSKVRALSRGRASISSGPPTVAVVKNNAVLRTGSGDGYLAFPLPGTRLVTAGRADAEFRVSLGPALEGWIDAKDVDLLPAGTPPPRAVTGAIHTAASDHATQVRIGLTERTAFTVDEDDDFSSLTLRLFNCTGHTNWIVYDSNDSFVEEVRWRQESTGVVAVTIRLNPRMTLWGWQASYEGSALRLELRRVPALAPAPASPLKGLTVVLDPGHMPSAMGATGPLGTREMDVNFAIAAGAAALLADRGALPVLTRTTPDQEVSLTERPRLAVEKKGDLLVSIHNNALSDGDNPFSRPRGFSVFYYHPHSLALARHLYRSYEARVPLPGEELRYGNLMVARLSAMPAVLVENAYMSFPSHEEKLNNPAFRKVLAQAIVAGLESFLQTERDKQPRPKPAPQPRTAAKGPPSLKALPKGALRKGASSLKGAVPPSPKGTADKKKRNSKKP